MDKGTVLNDLLARVDETRAQVGAGWPYHADPETGIWETTPDGDWCGGHWVEMLRLKGVLEGRADLIEEARDRTEALRPMLERDDQFRGHRFYYSAARMHAQTGDEALRTLALAAAWSMRAMAIAHNGAMPIGMEVQVKSTTLASRRIVAVDNVHPNLRLDYWAWRETGDDTFRRGAQRHLDLTIRDFLRPDGSTIEFIEYAQDEDRIERHFTLLGVDDDSCWSRGQAWAIAGFLRAWQEFGEDRYREAACSTFGYWLLQAGPGVPPWDFADPTGPRDSSATTIVLEQLARMAVAENAADFSEFTGHLEPMLEALAAHIRPTGRLVNGCFNRPRAFAEDNELIWGSAYLLMALAYLEEGSVIC